MYKVVKKLYFRELSLQSPLVSGMRERNFKKIQNKLAQQQNCEANIQYEKAARDHPQKQLLQRHGPQSWKHEHQILSLQSKQGKKKRLSLTPLKMLKGRSTASQIRSKKILQTTLRKSSLPSQEDNNLSKELLDIGVTGRLSPAEAHSLCSPIDQYEIENAIKQASPLKSPGPDGFNGRFFEMCQPIIGEDVTLVIKDYFTHSKLLKQVKHTFIALIPNQMLDLLLQVLDQFKANEL